MSGIHLSSGKNRRAGASMLRFCSWGPSPLEVHEADPNRPLSDYPYLDSNCLLGARELARAYPELRVETGVVTFKGDADVFMARYCAAVLASFGYATRKTGKDPKFHIMHAWCVRESDGVIVDPTFTLPDWGYGLKYPGAQRSPKKRSAPRSGPGHHRNGQRRSRP